MQDVILQLGKKYANLVVLTTESSCEGFAKFFPNRHFTFGRGSGNMVSAAAGFALRGKLPVIVGDGVVSECFDQVVNDICKPNLNVKIVDRRGVGLIDDLRDCNDLLSACEKYGATVVKI